MLYRPKPIARRKEGGFFTEFALPKVSFEYWTEKKSRAWRATRWEKHTVEEKERRRKLWRDLHGVSLTFAFDEFSL